MKYQIVTVSNKHLKTEDEDLCNIYDSFTISNCTNHWKQEHNPDPDMKIGQKIQANY